MIQLTPQMRILVAIEAVDFRKGIDSLARLCQDEVHADPFSGCLFVFRSRRATAITVLVYDGQGFWLAQKRLSSGRFRWWPASAHEAATALEAHQLQVLLAAGNPASAQAAPVWRPVRAAVSPPLSNLSTLGLAFRGRVCDAAARWTRCCGIADG